MLDDDVHAALVGERADLLCDFLRAMIERDIGAELVSPRRAWRRPKRVTITCAPTSLAMRSAVRDTPPPIPQMSAVSPV